MNTIDKMIDFFKSLQTEEIVGFLKQARIGEMIHHPYFLASAGALALICLILKWRFLLTLLILVVGFAELFTYSIARGTSLGEGFGNESLIIFIGIGTVIIAVVIYLLFIKSE